LNQEAIASASDGDHHDRSGRFHTTVFKTDRNKQVIFFFLLFVSNSLIIIGKLAEPTSGHNGMRF